MARITELRIHLTSVLEGGLASNVARMYLPQEITLRTEHVAKFATGWFKLKFRPATTVH